MNARRILLAAVALAVLLGGASLLLRGRAPAADLARAKVMIAGAYQPPRAAPDFALQGSDGGDVSLADHRGKVVLLTFGFTHCAAVCPTTLATLAQARDQLGPQADEVQAIFVTVDPARDTAARMREYLAAFDPTFIGATGDA